jgi:hypothetical protein
MPMTPRIVPIPKIEMMTPGAKNGDARIGEQIR